MYLVFTYNVTLAAGLVPHQRCLSSNVEWCASQSFSCVHKAISEATLNSTKWRAVHTRHIHLVIISVHNIRHLTETGPMQMLCRKKEEEKKIFSEAQTHDRP